MENPVASMQFVATAKQYSLLIHTADGSPDVRVRVGVVGDDEIDAMATHIAIDRSVQIHTHCMHTDCRHTVQANGAVDGVQQGDGTSALLSFKGDPGRTYNFTFQHGGGVGGGGVTLRSTIAPRGPLPGGASAWEGLQGELKVKLGEWGAKRSSYFEAGGGTSASFEMFFGEDFGPESRFSWVVRLISFILYTATVVRSDASVLA
jgi:hypothetical protein